MKHRPWWHAILGPDEDTSVHSPNFIWEQYKNAKRYKEVFYENVLLNHLQRNDCLITKKGLYRCLKSYCLKEGIDLLKIIPRTFYLTSCDAHKDDDMQEFMDINENRLSCLINSKSNNDEDEQSSKPVTPNDIIWIMKPASRTNRGFGIKVVQGINAVLEMVNKSASRESTKRAGSGGAAKKPKNVAAAASSASGKAAPGAVEKKSASPDVEDERYAKKAASQHGWIVQLYMDRPLLVSGRKFDIRCYVLVTHCAKKGLKGYFYQDAYVRTSSKKYSLSKLADRETHLTNDAVQKHSKSYGKFEEGNKLDLVEWQSSIRVDYPDAPENVVNKKIFPEIKRISQLTVKAAAETLSDSDVQKSFELFGYDFMIDEQFNPVLIEVNTNPCLEFACPLLTNIITELIENTIRVAVDSEFPPPSVGFRTKACEEAIEAIECNPLKFEKVYP